MGEIRTQITQQLADEIVAAIPFPLTVHLPTSLTGFTRDGARHAVASEELADIEAARVAVSGRSRSDLGLDTDGSFEDAFIEMIVRGVSAAGEVSRLPDNERGALQALLDELNLPAGATTEDVRSALESASDATVLALLRVLPVKFEFEWVRVTVQERPRVVLGVPITAQGVRVSVQARGKLCARIPILGWKCIGVTSPLVHLVGKNLNVHLKSTPPLLIGSLSFDDLDIEICAKIIKWKICVRIGVTGVVNKLLAGRKFKLVDFGSFEGAVPYSDAVVRVTNLTPSAAANALQIDATLTVSG